MNILVYDLDHLQGANSLLFAITQYQAMDIETYHVVGKLTDTSRMRNAKKGCAGDVRSCFHFRRFWEMA